MNWCDCSTIIFFNGKVIALEALCWLSAISTGFHLQCSGHRGELGEREAFSPLMSWIPGQLGQGLIGGGLHPQGVGRLSC